MSELIPGKRYTHSSWGVGHGGCIFLAKTSMNRLVFENFYGEGFTGIGKPEDYTEVKEKQKRWLNIYPKDNIYYLFGSKAAADLNAASNRVACVEIEYYEGMGLEKI